MLLLYHFFLRNYSYIFMIWAMLATDIPGTYLNSKLQLMYQSYIDPVFQTGESERNSITQVIDLSLIYEMI